MRRGYSDEGQASVEFALIVPLLGFLAMALLQVAVVIRDQVMVIHAAREGAREAAIDSAGQAARNAARSASPALEENRLDVQISGRGRPGSRVRVTLNYASPTKVPLVGPFIGDIRLNASATMRVER